MHAREVKAEELVCRSLYLGYKHPKPLTTK
jgi:hypothetical protein